MYADRYIFDSTISAILVFMRMRHTCEGGNLELDLILFALVSPIPIAFAVAAI